MPLSKKRLGGSVAWTRGRKGWMWWER